MLNELAPGIHWMPPDHTTDRPVLAGIAGDEAALMVDAGASSRHARQFLDAWGALSLPAVKYVLLTHSHWDHVFGASEIEAVAIATEKTRDDLATMATYAWSDAAIDERVADGFEIPFCRDMMKAELSAEERAALVLRVPERTFESETTIDLGGRSVQLLHVGGDHAPDSCIAVVPGVAAFLSDCIYPCLHAEPSYLTRRRLFPLLDRLLEREVAHYVLGHDDAPSTRAAFESRVRGLRAAAAEAPGSEPALVDAFRAGLAHE